MAEVIQLNLFGDITNFDDADNNQEVENESQLLGTDGSEPLGKISSYEIQSIEATGDTGTGTGESGRSSKRDDSGLDGKRTAPERSPGDSTTTIHTSDTGTGISTDSNRSVDKTLPRSHGTLRNGHTDDRGNYHITDSDNIGSGGKVAKFEANLSAIHLLKNLLKKKDMQLLKNNQSLLSIPVGVVYPEVFKENLEGAWLERTYFFEISTDN